MKRRCQLRLQPSPRHGLSRLEVVVVTLIAVIVFACCAPAAVGLREEARKVTCKDNLHKIGQAYLEFHSSHGHFPPAHGVAWDFEAKKPTGNPAAGCGWMAYLLPFMKKEKLAKDVEPWVRPKELAVYKQWEVHVSRPIATGMDERVKPDLKLLPFAATEISEYRCPSGEQPKVTKWGFATASYAGNLGFTMLTADEFKAYMMGSPLDKSPDGFFDQHGRLTKMSHVTDGLTYTIAVSEAGVPGPADKKFTGNKTFQPQWIGSPHGDWRALLRRVRHDQLPNTGPESFNSAHFGGVHALGGDGAVHFVSNKIHPATWVSLGTRRRLISKDIGLRKVAVDEWESDKDDDGNPIIREIQNKWPETPAGLRKEQEKDEKEKKAEQPPAQNGDDEAGLSPWIWIGGGIGVVLLLVVGFLLVAGRRNAA